MSEALDTSQIESELEQMSGWTLKEDKIHKEYSFNNFKEAMAFLVRVGFEAEGKGHHPEIFNVYSTVKIALQTHDAGSKVTEKDIELAKAIDSILN